MSIASNQQIIPQLLQVFFFHVKIDYSNAIYNYLNCYPCLNIIFCERKNIVAIKSPFLVTSLMVMVRINTIIVWNLRFHFIRRFSLFMIRTNKGRIRKEEIVSSWLVMNLHLDGYFLKIWWMSLPYFELVDWPKSHKCFYCSAHVFGFIGLLVIAALFLVFEPAVGKWIFL